MELAEQGLNSSLPEADMDSPEHHSCLWRGYPSALWRDLKQTYFVGDRWEASPLHLHPDIPHQSHIPLG